MSSPSESDRHHQPHLTSILRSLDLDVVYHRGDGDFLYYFDAQGEEVEVLDLVGGYGSLLLGHSHPAILAEAKKVLCQQRPHHAQGSLRSFANRLARELSRRSKGNYTAIFANSGSEAVEAAMKHAMLETGCTTFLTLEGAFHGKTLGALQLTAHPVHRDPFPLIGVNVIRIRPNDLGHLIETFEANKDIAGFFLEPIQGEAGIRLIDPQFAALAAKLCADRCVPLIADECQTGMGRTGSFLGCEALGIEADYVILSKSLGGGLAKISALLIRQQRYLDQLDLQFTSTYADDDYSCAIALKSLALIDDEMLRQCREKGQRLLAGLHELRTRYGSVIKDVRGRGLMVGIEFRHFDRSPSFLLRFLTAQKKLLHLIAGCLLNVHRIRVATTLSDPFTLRLQPSVLIEPSQIDRLLMALDHVCRALNRHDAVGLTQYLLERSDPGFRQPAKSNHCSVFPFDPDRFSQPHDCSTSGVAWLFHLLDAENLSSLEPSLRGLTIEYRHPYVERLSEFAEPVVMSSVMIRSRTGQRVRFYPILLPITSSRVRRWIDARQHRIARSLVQRGIDVAGRLGCSVVSLGQYTSIVTNNGKSLDSLGMGITTGNSYATALVIQAIGRAHISQGSKPDESVLAVVGAGGNIGRICAEMLAPNYRKTILVGTDNTISKSRLTPLLNGNLDIHWTTDIRDVNSANVVVAAVSSVDMLLGPEHLAMHCIVCDVSIPTCLQPEIRTVRPDITIINGGIVELPFGEDLEITGFPLPTGKVYGCLAEGLLLGMEQIRDRIFTGSLNSDHITRIEQIARRHGFELSYDAKSNALSTQNAF